MVRGLGRGRREVYGGEGGEGLMVRGLGRGRREVYGGEGGEGLMVRMRKREEGEKLVVVKERKD
jgi:hypothetical protein